MRAVRNVLLFVALCWLSLSAQQITGSIRGTVTDPMGAIVQGATVTVQQSETDLSRTAVTDRSGNYVVLELPVGGPVVPHVDIRKLQVAEIPSETI